MISGTLFLLGIKPHVFRMNLNRNMSCEWDSRSSHRRQKFHPDKIKCTGMSGGPLEAQGFVQYIFIPKCRAANKEMESSDKGNSGDVDTKQLVSAARHCTSTSVITALPTAMWRLWSIRRITLICNIPPLACSLHCGVLWADPDSRVQRKPL